MGKIMCSKFPSPRQAWYGAKRKPKSFSMVSGSSSGIFSSFHLMEYWFMFSLFPFAHSAPLLTCCCFRWLGCFCFLYLFVIFFGAFRCFVGPGKTRELNSGKCEAFGFRVWCIRRECFVLGQRDGRKRQKTHFSLGLMSVRDLRIIGEGGRH